MTFPLPQIMLHVTDKIRLQTKFNAGMVPTGMNLYIVKVDKAPDGTKVVWLSSAPPTKEDLTPSYK